MQANEFDAKRAEAFAGRLLDMLNGGALSLMISIGHRTRLFDALGAAGPVTSAELAARADLNERYVREWLAAMTVGGIVETDDGVRYHLPAEHVASLSRTRPAENMAMFAQYIGQLGAVENDIVECFHNGGGVPYERFTRFHELMAEDSGQSVLPALDGPVLELVPGLRERLARGIHVLDAGCGRGLALMRLAELFPDSRFVGLDLSEDAIDWARCTAVERGLDNVTFIRMDLRNFHQDAGAENYDLVFTFDAVHDQAKPLHLLQGIHKTLKADGVYVMQDIHAHSHVRGNLDNPMAPLLYTVSCMHCMTVSLAQGGDGLGAMWGRDKAKELLREAGFGNIEIKRMDHDIQNDWYVIRK